MESYAHKEILPESDFRVFASLSNTLRDESLPYADTIFRRGELMANLSGVVQQLKKERDRAQEEVKGLNAALAALTGLKAGPARKRRTLSAAVRRKMSLAQKARWARRTSGTEAPTARPKRTMSAAARRKIAAAQRARWAKVKAKQQKKAG